MNLSNYCSTHTIYCCAYTKYAAALLVAWLMLSGCQPQMPQTARSGLVYCSEGSPESFNPQLVTSGTTIDIISQQLYDRLVDIDPDNGDIVAGLATSWHVSADGTRYQFNLRDNVSFHSTRYFSPSRKFNANDVQFTFNRITDLNHPFHFEAGGIYPYFQSVDWANLVKKVEAIDDYTVIFELQRPDSSFLSNLATDFAAILSAEYGQQLLAAKQPGQIDRLPVGTGPFRFREYQKDILVRFYRHNDYWRGNTQPEQLVFDIVPNNARRMAKLFTHECDIVAYPRVAELELIAKREDVTVQESTSMNVGFWAFNTQKPPFDQLEVRQALGMAINRAAIMQAVYYGKATPAYGILPPTSWAYNAGLPAPMYSPAKARALLTKAGYPNGFTMNIWAMPVQRLYNPNALKMAELMQADLAQIGIKANIISYEWNSFRQKLGNYEHDSVLIGWAADNADPDNFFRPLLSCAARDSGSNRANWCDPMFDDIIGQALLTADQQQRRALYLTAQQYLHQQQPLVAIAHSQRFQAISSSVSGVSINPYGGISLQHAKRVSP